MEESGDALLNRFTASRWKNFNQFEQVTLCTAVVLDLIAKI